MNSHQISVLYHNYYSLDGIYDIRERLAKISFLNPLLLMSVNESLFSENKVKQEFNEIIFRSTNKGKDIGGKLLMIDYLIRFGHDIPYTILLHDKMSHHKHSGSFERENLFRIVDMEVVTRAMDNFKNEADLGILCTGNCIKNEYNSKSNEFNTTNNPQLKQLIQQYNIVATDYSFAAGTMFMIKTSLLTNFFKKHSPMAIRRSLEHGNPLDHAHGTVTHSWERMLSWIATSNGLKIKNLQ